MQCARYVEPRSNTSATLQMSCFHLDVKLAATPQNTDNQPTIEQSMLYTLSQTSERAKKITQSIATFIAKDLHHYSFVENPGFRVLLHTLEPRYRIPSLSFFTDTTIPGLYSDTKSRVMGNASRVAITCDSWTSITTDSYVTVTVTVAV